MFQQQMILCKRGGSRSTAAEHPLQRRLPDHAFFVVGRPHFLVGYLL